MKRPRRIDLPRDLSPLLRRRGRKTETPSAVFAGGGMGATDPGAVREGDAAGGDLGGTYPDPTVPGLATKQPLDSDLTAIAALSTTSFGRSLLEAANAAALRTLAGTVIGTDVQAYDADLAAIAALSTTSYGRSLLEAANAGALRTLAGLVIGTDVQAYDAELAALAGLTSAANKIPRFTGSGTADLLDLDTDGTLAANSDTKLASQKAIKTYVDALKTALEPWRVDIDPFETASTHTNFNTNQQDNLRVKAAYLLSSGAQNAEVGWDIVLSAGTWTFSLLHLVGTNRGIYTVSLDGSSIGTIDGYAAATAQSLSTITGVSVASSGKKRLLLKMATKNASSTNYFGLVNGIALLRTA